MRTVFFVCTSEFFGGAEWVGLQVQKILKEKFKVVTVVNQKNAARFADIGHVLYSSFIPSKYAKVATNFTALFYFLLIFPKKIFWRFQWNKDSLIYCNDIESLLIAIPLKLFFHCHIIWHIHDIYKIEKLKTRILLTCVTRFVDTLVCLTPKNSARMRHIFSGRIEVLPSYPRTPTIDLKFCLQETANAPFKLGFLGQITRWKGIETSIEVVHHLHASSLVNCFTIGGTPLFDQDKDYATTLIKKTSGYTYLKWIGHVDDVEQFFSNIDFLIVLSENEPFGLVILEALSRGVPVISARGDGPDELITPGTGYFLDPHDESSMLELEQTMSNMTKDDYSRMRANCVARASQFSQITFKRKLLDTIDATLYPRRNGGALGARDPHP